MYKRPELGESDEDLLKLQNDFYKDKENTTFQPAAKVMNAKIINPSKIEEIPADNETAISPDNLIANTFETIPTDMKIGEVKPVTVQNKIKISLDSIVLSNNISGFPQAKKREISTTSKSGSIFSQEMKKLKRNSEDIHPKPSTSSTAAIAERNIPSKSYILMGEDSTDLHRQNSDRMSHMSEAEILAEREQLLSTLDPAIIAFLKSKRYHNKQIADKKEEIIKTQNMQVNIENIETVGEILRDPNVDSWLNFNKIESNKLGWMESIQLKDVRIKEDEYEARFDFNGYLLPFSIDQIDEKNRSLYHHGQEPERPGYTLQELFQLCRSTVLQQKTTALHTIANLLHLYSTGLYPAALLTLPIEQIFFVLRFAMDDNIPSVILASTRTMCALLCRELDEQCLDNMMSFGYQLQPVLSVSDRDADEEVDDGRMNDQEMVEVDVIRVAVRSGLVSRIRYILNACETPNTIINCLNLLIRLARDSKYVLNTLMNEHNLLDILVEKLQPILINDIAVTIRIIKFLRVFFSRSKGITVKLLKKHDIFAPLIYYSVNENITSNSQGIHLQTECFNLWTVFLHYKLGCEHIS